MKNNIPGAQQIYRHFKGNLYQVITLAEHSETGEKLVIYQALYGEYKVYARPLSGFLEKLDNEKYPDAKQEYRFEPVNVTEKKQECKPAGAAEKKQEYEPADAAEKKQECELSGAAEKQEIESFRADDSSAGGEKIPDIDPLVLEFLDADSYEERLNILASLHHRITDDMINTMAMSVDVEIKEGDIEERYEELRKCLLLYDKFECTRLR